VRRGGGEPDTCGHERVRDRRGWWAVTCGAGRNAGAGLNASNRRRELPRLSLFFSLSHAATHSLTPPHQLAAEDELTWDDGTNNPEYCVDRWDDVGKVRKREFQSRTRLHDHDPNPARAPLRAAGLRRGGPRWFEEAGAGQGRPPDLRSHTCTPALAPTLAPNPHPHTHPQQQQYQALRWLGAGLGLFGGAALLAARLDKRSTVPFVPRAYPFDSLSTELAGSKGVGPRD
jgi:hypothetical protein